MEQKRGIDSFTLHILAMLFYALRSFVGNIISGAGMADMRRKCYWC